MASLCMRTDPMYKDGTYGGGGVPQTPQELMPPARGGGSWPPPIELHKVRRRHASKLQRATRKSPTIFRNCDSHNFHNVPCNVHSSPTFSYSSYTGPISPALPCASGKLRAETCRTEGNRLRDVTVGDAQSSRTRHPLASPLSLSLPHGTSSVGGISASTRPWIHLPFATSPRSSTHHPSSAGVARQPTSVSHTQLHRTPLSTQRRRPSRPLRPAPGSASHSRATLTRRRAPGMVRGMWGTCAWRAATCRCTRDGTHACSEGPSAGRP